MNIPENRAYFLTKSQLIVAPLFAVKEYRLRPDYFKEISKEEGQAIIREGAKLIGRNYSTLDAGGFVSLDDRLEFYSIDEESN